MASYKREYTLDQSLSYLITALGLAFLIESLPWLIAPKKMQGFLRELMEMQPEFLRYWGIFLLIMALFLVWLGRTIL